MSSTEPTDRTKTADPPESTSCLKTLAADLLAKGGHYPDGTTESSEPVATQQQSLLAKLGLERSEVERRASLRIPRHFELEIRVGDEMLNGTGVDLSLSGLCFAVRGPITIDVDQVEVRRITVGGRRFVPQQPATIVWSDWDYPGRWSFRHAGVKFITSDSTGPQSPELRRAAHELYLNLLRSLAQ